MMGLSPSTRGNLSCASATPPGSRGIPVHAGEPALVLGVSVASRIYPRPRGGTPITNHNLPFG